MMRRGRSRLALGLAALGLCALAAQLVLPEAFAAASGRNDSLVAMQGGARRQNRRNHPKKRAAESL